MADLFRAVNMLSTLEMTREKYGGAEGYVIKKCGLTQKDVERIRVNLTIEAPPIKQLVGVKGGKIFI
jgi:hypothetical protein